MNEELAKFEKRPRPGQGGAWDACSLSFSALWHAARCSQGGEEGGGLGGGEGGDEGGGRGGRGLSADAPVGAPPKGNAKKSFDAAVA